MYLHRPTLDLLKTATIDSIIHGLETRKITEFHARFDFRKLYSLLNVYRCYSESCPYAAFQVGGCGNVIKGTIFQIIYMLAGFICRFIDTHALQLSVYGLIYYSHI